MNRKARKSLRKAIERRFEKNKWMRFCKEHNPSLYNREIDRVIHAETFDYIKMKKKRFLGKKINQSNRKNIFYGH